MQFFGDALDAWQEDHDQHGVLHSDETNKCNGNGNRGRLPTPDQLDQPPRHQVETTTFVNGRICVFVHVYSWLLLSGQTMGTCEKAGTLPQMHP